MTGFAHDFGQIFFSSLLLLSLELSDTKVYKPSVRALLGTASRFCEVVGQMCWTGLGFDRYCLFADPGAGAGREDDVGRAPRGTHPRPKPGAGPAGLHPPNTPRFTPYTLQPIPYTLHLPPHTLPHTLHPTPHTTHPTLHTLHPTHHTLYPTPYSPHPTPHIPHPTLYTPHPTPFTLGCAVKHGLTCLQLMFSGRLPGHSKNIQIHVHVRRWCRCCSRSETLHWRSKSPSRSSLDPPRPSAVRLLLLFHCFRVVAEALSSVEGTT